GDSVITFAINPLVFRPADADGHVDPDCCAIPGPFYSVTTTSLTGPSFTMDFLTLESISALGATTGVGADLLQLEGTGVITFTEDGTLSPNAAGLTNLVAGQT